MEYLRAVDGFRFPQAGDKDFFKWPLRGLKASHTDTDMTGMLTHAA